jgi:hypothetical protein
MGNDARNWDKVWALSRLSNCIMANIGGWAISLNCLKVGFHVEPVPTS